MTTKAAAKPKTYRVQLVKPRRYNYRGHVYDRWDVIEVLAADRNYLVIETEGAWADYVERKPVLEPVEVEPVAVEDGAEETQGHQISVVVPSREFSPGKTDTPSSEGRNSDKVNQRSGGTEVG